MALIWITGAPGAGKTTTSRALRKRGFEAYDADLDGFRMWRRRDTSEEVVFPGWPAPVGWHDEHRMPIVRSRVERLLGNDEPVFLSGSVDNELDVWDLFSVVICLVVDETTLRHRLATRPDHYGKDAAELANILEWNRACEANYRRVGASIVDAGRPLESVVDNVLEVVAGHAR